MLHGEETLGDDHGQHPAGQAEQGNAGSWPEPGVVVGRNMEERAATEDRRVDPSGDAGRHHQRDEGPGGELEEQQLDGQHHRGERRAEGRRHPGRGAAGEEDLSLRWGDVDHLAEQRADRPAGDDDRPLGAERAARADGDRGRYRLRQRLDICDAAGGHFLLIEPQRGVSL